MTATGADAAPLPAAFVATTVQVYAVPFVAPAMVNGVTLPVAVRVAPPPTQVAVYIEIDAPPSAYGAEYAIEMVPSPPVALTDCGAPGTVRGVAVTAADATPEPATFAAETVQLYTLPLVSPVMMIGLLDPVLVRAMPPSSQ